MKKELNNKLKSKTELDQETLNEALRFATENNDFAMFKKAIKNGADMNYAVYLALFDDRYKMLEYALKQGATVDTEHYHLIELIVDKQDSAKYYKLLTKHGYKPSSFEVESFLFSGNEKEKLAKLMDLGVDVKDAIGMVEYMLERNIYCSPMARYGNGVTKYSEDDLTDEAKAELQDMLSYYESETNDEKDI